MSGNDLKYMKAAIAVAEELNFSRAAKRLHLSQPAITKYIAELEDMLGTMVFFRDHHVVSLMDAGRAYVEEARIAVVPPFLNGRAVFAHKHALALAHASGGGKCKRRVKELTEDE